MTQRTRHLRSPIALVVPWVTVVPAITLDPHFGAAVGLVAVITFGAILIAQEQYRSRDVATEGDRRHAPEEPSLSDRERVQELLEENGGRMRQSDIVDSVDWSKAKVSRLLSDLEDDGEVSKLRLGRENLVCLPGSEPTASKSPEHAKTD